MFPPLEHKVTFAITKPNFNIWRVGAHNTNKFLIGVAKANNLLCPTHSTCIKFYFRFEVNTCMQTR
jgi:hypothetical protein